MATGSFDFAPLLPEGLPPAAARWTGLAKYSFIGGNNDPDQVPVEGLIDAVNAVLQREGRALWWDKTPVALGEERQMDEGRVAMTPYVYQTK